MPLLFQGRARKGQFFIISAVIILLTLYSIVNALNSNWQTDVSEVQGNDAAEIFENIENGINRTVSFSDSTDIEENLETFMLVEKNAIGDQYTLDMHFNIAYPNVTANIMLSSKTFYAMKEMRFIR